MEEWKHVNCRRKQRIEKRVVVITEYRIITLRTGMMTGYHVVVLCSFHRRLIEKD